MKKTLPLAILTAAVSLAGQSALAHPVGQATPGYVGDSRGMLVTDSSGNCVRTSSWAPALATEACDASLVKKAAPAPAPAKAEPAPAPKPAPQPVAEKVSLTAGALFDVNKADLKPAGKSELDALAAKLKGAQVEQITVTGHTDSSGSKQLNQSLSERRADAVKAYLVSKGLDGSRIDAKGAGDTQPVASNKTADGRAQNRRVEIDIRAQRTTSN
ncbi:membrane protein [Sulfuricaulis limicola]|uniref:Membrane protein n=1 Tax=Sulfuricaulis limicola TaxID=1620215 RepID=A0A1B4XCT4_9GAMM|nr:OmpA family protein [Sulfuricaulis limicola]BAV32634.1 membrane protein [Sulfuricaulis limicola]